MASPPRLTHSLALPEDLPVRAVGDPPTRIIVLPPRRVGRTALALLAAAAAAGDWLDAPGKRSLAFRYIGRLARRGWVELDRPAHFRRWRLTEGGRLALASLRAGGGLGGG